jgi:hypothetical protein
LRIALFTRDSQRPKPGTCECNCCGGLSLRLFIEKVAVQQTPLFLSCESHPMSDPSGVDIHSL